MEIHQFVSKKVNKELAILINHYTNTSFVDTLKKVSIQLLQCPELINPEWGTVNIMQNARGLFTAAYKCMSQHSISGDRLRFCSPTSGQWSGSTPRCLPSKTLILIIHYTLYLWTSPYIDATA